MYADTIRYHFYLILAFIQQVLYFKGVTIGPVFIQWGWRLLPCTVAARHLSFHATTRSGAWSRGRSAGCEGYRRVSWTNTSPICREPAGSDCAEGLRQTSPGSPGRAPCSADVFRRTCTGYTFVSAAPHQHYMSQHTLTCHNIHWHVTAYTDMSQHTLTCHNIHWRATVCRQIVETSACGVLCAGH